MTAVGTLPDLSQALCFLYILLVPFAAAGLALINAGLGRSRNAAHMMLSSLGVFALAAIVFFVVGFAWQGFPGRPAYAFTLAGKSWNWIAAEPFFWRGLHLDGSPASLAALLGMLSAGLAAVIPLGSGADRWRLGAACGSTVILAGGTYPLFAHWVWGGGWLAQLGFVDAGGAMPIQAVGGITALAVTWILKPRRGKYAHDRMPLAIPGHNTVIVLLGCFLAWFGWIGLDCAGATLYYGAEASRFVLIAANATLAAASAMLAAACVARLRFGKPDASLCANGWVGGLVASSAGCAVLPPAAAMIVGLVAGVLIPYAVGWLELNLRVDDPGGSVSVHLIGGIWGTLAVAFLTRAGDWIPQLVGIATLLGFVFPVAYGLNWLLDHFYPQRVPPEGERQGLDLQELGAGAYPDFLTHNDDYLQR